MWCNEGCNLLWDGFGRWVNNNWLQYKSSESEYCFIVLSSLLVRSFDMGCEPSVSRRIYFLLPSLPLSRVLDH